jgi:DNA-binding NarL/FixJ family response regulator
MRVFIADAHLETRLALMMTLREEPGMSVTGMAVEAQGLVGQVKASQPDVLLLDWHLPGQPVTDVLADLKTLERRPQIIVLSIRPEVESEALAAGADAFVSKSVPPNGLLALLRTMQQTTTTDPSK